MPGDPFRRVKPGDSLRGISAAGWNGAMDAARAFAESNLSGGAGSPIGTTPQTGIVLVQNNSGGDLDRFSVLGIDSPLISPTDGPDAFKSRVMLVGITPATASHKAKFVILREPLKNGKIGQAYIAGACPCKINVNNANDAAADVKNSDAASLDSGASGAAKILWKESGTGLKWAYVLLPQGGGTGGAIPVKITNIETSSGGKYKGRSITILASTVGVANTGLLVMPPSSYTIAATDDLMLYHPLESGLSTHTIPYPCFALAYDTGLVTTDATPRKIMQLENIGVRPGTNDYDVYQMVSSNTVWGPTKAQ